MLRLLGRDDRGAVGVIVAVLIGGGVLTGMAAMVIDVGQLYQNRAELQNGADAAALAVAQSCAEGNCQPTLAPGYATANASDLTGGQAAAPVVCGVDSADPTALNQCPPPTGRMVDCPAAPVGATNYVDVYTETDTPTGPLLPPVFARALLGNSGYSGTTVAACARAAWFPPASADTLAFTISACQWDAITNVGTNFAPPPPATPAPSYDVKVVLHGKSSNFGCPTEPAGADGPGNFDWLDSNPKKSCTLDITPPTYTGKPGVSDPGCASVMTQDYLNKTIVFIPVYITEDVQGNTGTYTLKTFAAFVITGFGIPGGYEQDLLNPANDCKGSIKCIDGYFTQAVFPGSGGTPGGTDGGATEVALTG
jgi:Flp pilus assembly protein TadG